MSKHKNNIHELYPLLQKAETDILAQLDLLLIGGNYKKVIEETEKAIIKYPGNSFFYIMKSIAHSQIGQKDEALKTLKQAEEKFPPDYEILFQLAKIYEDLRDYPNAEKYYRKSYDLTPKKFKDARSDCLNDLGALNWGFNFRDVALVYWRLAIKEYPKNIKAKENLKNCSNKYGEPASPNKLFDDIYHFQKIQTRKYFEVKDKIEFSSPDEVNQVIGIINDTWNNKIAPEKDKLDTLSVDEINKLFESFDLNFSNLE
jgi:tetratricopeptide (TPR) repeat protein